MGRRPAMREQASLSSLYKCYFDLTLIKDWNESATLSEKKKNSPILKFLPPI